MGDSEKLSEKTVRMLGEVRDHFVRDLVRLFHEEGERYFYKTGEPLPLGSFYFKTETSKGEIKDAALSKRPTYQITEFVSNLEKQTLFFAVDLGKIELYGELWESKEGQVEHSGKLLITVSNLKFEGKVGTFTREDSFFPISSNFEFTAEDINLELKEGEKIVQKSKIDSFDDHFCQCIWGEFKYLVISKFIDQMTDVVVEFSVQETLCDEDAEYKEFVNKKVQRNNEYIDKIIAKLSGSLGSDVIMPTFTGTNEEFVAHTGTLSDLKTLSRHGDFCFLDYGDKVLLCGNLRFKKFELIFHHLSINVDGESTQCTDVKYDLNYQNELEIKLVFAKDENGLVFKEVRRDTHFYEGRPYLYFNAEHLNTSLLAFVRLEVLPEVKSRIFDAIEAGFRNDQLPQFKNCYP